MLPLILLPGLMCDARIYASQLSVFPRAQAAADYGDCTSLAAMAKRVIAAAPAQFALLGHSMGARVALEVFRLAPDRVKGLALASTGVHAPGDGEADKRYALRDLGRVKGFEALVQAWLPPMLASKNRDDATLMTKLREMCLSAGQSRYESQIEALLSRPEVESLLPAIRCPTLVAVGTEDRWSPPEQHRTIAAAIPGAELVIVEGAGHMLPAEASGALNTAVARWLARIESTETLSSRRE